MWHWQDNVLIINMLKNTMVSPSKTICFSPDFFSALLSKVFWQLGEELRRVVVVVHCPGFGGQLFFIDLFANLIDSKLQLSGQ